jgi:S1-C subfamily serine protease
LDFAVIRQFIFQFITIFSVGILGGIFGSQILWPLLVERPLFYKYRLEQAPTYVTEKNEIVVQENVALTQAIDKVRKTLVGIRAVTPAGKVILGSGLILTSDGFVVTLNDLLPGGADVSFVIDGEKVPYEILKRDTQNNLALVKLQKSGLSTLGFADLQTIKLGQRVFFAAIVANRGKEFSWALLTNEGVVRTISEEAIETNIFEDSLVRGSPLFTIDGQIIGLNILDREGRVVVIPNTLIRQFAGF